MKESVKYALLSVLMLGLALISFCFDKQFDDCADNYFKTAMSKAAAGFVTARGVNAAISVAKSTQISAEPLGVGVSVGVGEVLDPVDDVIESLSNLMFTAMISLSVQKISYSAIALIGKTALLVLAGTLILTLPLMRWERGKFVWTHVLRIFLLALILRCLLPICALVNLAADNYFFQPQMDDCRETLSIIDSQTTKFRNEIFGDNDHGISQKIDYSKRYLGTIFRNASNIVDAAISFAGLLAAQFFLQVICLPVLSFWILRIAVKLLYGNDYLRRLTTIFSRERVPADSKAR